jgi:hypothetical protein
LEIKDSVARIVWSHGSNTIAGTAFPISRRHLVTCRHCVPVPGIDVRAEFRQANGRVQCMCRAIWYHFSADLAILQTEEELPLEITPFQLGPSPSQNERWSSFGYPQSDSSGRPVGGRVQSATHRADGQAWLDLRADTSAELEGMSGSPVVVNRIVVGVVTKETSLEGIYAVPASEVTQALFPEGECPHEFCKYSSHNRVRIECSALSPTPPNGSSTLFYGIYNVKNDLMASAKGFIEALRPNSDFGTAGQMVLWSLLGSRELLLHVRAPKPVAENIREQVTEIFRKLWKGGNPQAEWIPIGEEYVASNRAGLVQSGGKVFQVAKVTRVPATTFNTGRFVKAFIYMSTSETKPPHDTEEYLQKVLDRLSKFESCIDVIAVSRDRHHVVVELTMPCGNFPSMHELTVSMEDGFNRGDFSKRTFVAYECGQIPRETDGASQVTGSVDEPR